MYLPVWSRKHEPIKVSVVMQNVSGEDMAKGLRLSLDSKLLEFTDVMDKAIFVKRGLFCVVEKWIKPGESGLVEVDLN